MLNFIGHITSSKSNEYTINIYNDNYNDEAIELMLTSCIITRGNSDIFDPIISSGCKIEFINNLTDNQLSDLFNIYEKTYRLEVTTIDYSDSSVVTVFKGWLAVDLIEKGIDYQPTISLEFVDYLKKLNEINPSEMDGSFMKLNDVLVNTLKYTKINQNIKYNNSLHSDGTALTSTSSLFEKNYCDTNNFSNDGKINDGQSVLKKVLTPFCSYIYSYDNNYYVQSYADLDNSTLRNWRTYNVNTSVYTSTTCEKHILNHNNDDFILYEGGSISYESGLKALEINLKQKTYDNLTPNTFDRYTVINDIYTATGLTNGMWYLDNSIANYKTGYNSFGMNRWLSYDWRGTGTPNHREESLELPVTNQQSISYKFRFTVDKKPLKPTNQLNINYKILRNSQAYSAKYPYYQLITIKILSGNLAGKYLTVDANGVNHLSDNKEFTWHIVFVADPKDPTISDSIGINLQSIVDLYNLNDMTVLITFFPYSVMAYIGGTFKRVYEDQVIGDIVTTYSQSTQDNRVNASISGNFTKNESVTLDLFDTINLNYTNAFYYFTTDYFRTSTWKSDNIVTDTYEEIYKKFLKNRFNYFAKTRQKLTCEITTNKLVKPLTIIELSNTSKRYFITKINHNLFKDDYRIEAFEIGYEEINII